MTEKVREILYKPFRGLPDYKCELDGKSIVVCGGNGKGKSAIVDGIEFFFSGSLRRFHGEGSGGIDADQAIRNLFNPDTPIVELAFTPTNERIARKLGERTLKKPSHASIQQYVDRHPSVGSFVLRRSEIQEFISDQEAKRYQKFIRLLGIDDIDDLQKSFVEAKRQIDEQCERIQSKKQRLLERFADPEISFEPASLTQILSKCADLSRPFGVKKLADLTDLDAAISILERKRLPQAKAKLDLLNAALDRLATEVPTEIEDCVGSLNSLHRKLMAAKTEQQESSKGQLISTGLEYFEQNRGVKKCPLCEQELRMGYNVLVERLGERIASLGRFRDLERERLSVLDSLETLLHGVLYQLAF